MNPHPPGTHPLYGYESETRTATCRACRISELDLPPEEAGPWLLTVVTSAPPGERPEERAARLAVPFLAYLRPGSELEDAREIALSFALWAGQDLAALMQYDAERIAGYTQARAS